MCRAVAQSICPRWLTHERLARLTPAHWMTPAIRRCDESFYLALADLPRLGSYKDAVVLSLSAEFCYVRASNPETIESVTVRLTRPPGYFAVLESQLRKIADLLASRLRDGSLLLDEYEFDGEDFVESQWPAMSLA